MQSSGRAGAIDEMSAWGGRPGDIDMPLRIEDYGLIGDTQTAGLVGKDGSIDWLCLPRFDSPACFAKLLGTREHGRWVIQPESEIQSVHRRYHPDTLVLETTFVVEGGAFRLLDFMPMPSDRADVTRIVEGVHGKVSVQMEFVLRTDYGSVVPWVHRFDGGIMAIAGPDSFRLRSPVP